MNLVAWNSAIQIKKKTLNENSNTADKLWYEIARPRSSEELVGNKKGIQEIEEWFRAASSNLHTSSCLFVHGESGTGKSTAVSLIAEKFKFQAVTTYADKSRTPARLEGVVREAGVYGSKGVVVLDDFEIFLSETTSLRVISKLLRQLLNASQSNVSHSRCLFIIICNSKHKLFGSLQDISKLVHFERLQQPEIYNVFARLASRVKRHSYVPPMALYLSSVTNSGTITQGLQQLQLIYTGNTMTTFGYRPRNKKRKFSADARTSSYQNQNNCDCISYLWSDIYTDKILEHLVDARFEGGRVIDRLMGFERGQLELLGGQLHDDYARRMTSVEQLRDVAESMSMSDTNRIEIHDDALYDGENRDGWSVNDISFVSLVAYGILAIKGQRRRDQSWSRKPHTRLLKCNVLII